MHGLSRRALISAALACVLTGGGRAVAAEADPRTAEIRGIFQPFETDLAALAPDGKHLAFERRKDERLFLVIVDLATNQAMELPLVDDIAVPLSGVVEKVPARLTYLKWASADRLLACVQDEVLIAVDANGKNFTRLIDALIIQDLTRRVSVSGTSTLAAGADDAAEPTSGRSAIINPDGSSAGWGGGSDVGSLDRSRYTLGRIGDIGESATFDLFDSANQPGPTPGRRPRVLEILTDEPDTVVIEIRGAIGPMDDVDVRRSSSLRTTMLKLNVRTGVPREIFDEYYTTRIFVDKDGDPRAILHQVGNDRVVRFAPKGGERFSPYTKALEGSGVTGLEVTPKGLLDQRAVPLGFGYDPAIFYYASNVGRDTFAIRSVDVANKRDLGVVMEHRSLDFVLPAEMLPEDVLVFDRFKKTLVGARLNGLKAQTHWIDPALAELQSTLEQASSGMSVEILEWDAERTKFLLRVSSQTEPGAFYLYDTAKGKVLEYARRAPWIKSDATNFSRSLALTTPAGVTLTGYLTLPRTPRITPTPLLIYCHDGPWTRDQPGYDRGAQALATMGFAVLQVNYRGSAGFGRAHLLALREKGETAALADILALADLAQANGAISKKRVAILGNGYGGYLALRAMQEFPERFRCALSINAPTNLQRWMTDTGEAFSFNGGVREWFLGRESAVLKAASPALNGKPIKGPVLIVQATNDQLVPERHARDLQRAMSNGPVKPELLELEGEGHARWLPGSYVKVFDRMEEFFTANIFTYSVEMGPTEVAK